MMNRSDNFRWKPVEAPNWSRFAYGRCVMFGSEGGTLSTAVKTSAGKNVLYLRAAIEGRMLIEVYANDEQIYETLVSNDELDSFVDLPALDRPQELEVHFIPATNGMVRIMRHVELVSTDDKLAKQILDSKASKDPAAAAPSCVQVD